MKASARTERESTKTLGALPNGWPTPPAPPFPAPTSWRWHVPCLANRQRDSPGLYPFQIKRENVTGRKSPLPFCSCPLFPLPNAVNDCSCSHHIKTKTQQAHKLRLEEQRDRMSLRHWYYFTAIALAVAAQLWPFCYVRQTTLLVPSSLLCFLWFTSEHIPDP